MKELTLKTTVANADKVAPTRWRNGGGWTRELLAWPAIDDWTLRVSVADIESSGAFSHFSNVDRYFAVIQGAGVRLHGGGGTDRRPTTVTTESAMYFFHSEAAVDCQLIDGPVRDVNFMIRRDRATLTVRSAENSSGLIGDRPYAGLFTTGRCLLTMGRQPHELEPLTLVSFETADHAQHQFDLTIETGRAWWIDLALRR